MIFVAVGTQLRFDRLAEAVDDWCQDHRDQEVYAQLGPVGDQGYQPRHYEWVESVPKTAFEKKLELADFVVAHAGIGTILTALSKQKPVLLMPRLAELSEHRNDHQLATVREFEATEGVFVAHSPSEIEQQMDFLCSTVVPTAPLEEHSDGNLVRYLQKVLAEPC